MDFGVTIELNLNRTWREAETSHCGFKMSYLIKSYSLKLAINSSPRTSDIFLSYCYALFLLVFIFRYFDVATANKNF